MSNQQFQYIKMYLYESTNLKTFFYQVLELLHHEFSFLEDKIIKKGWVNGPHLHVSYKCPETESSEEVNEQLFKVIKHKLASFEDSCTNADYRKYEMISERLAQAERFEGKYLPLKLNHTIESGTYDISQIKTVYDWELYSQIEIAKTDFFIKNYQYLSRLDEKQRELLSAKLMLITASHFEIVYGKEILKGIKFGNLSFKSHYEGFLAQLDLMNEQKRNQILAKMNAQTDIMSTFINEEFSYFIEAVDFQFVHYYQDDRKTLLDWDHLTNDIKNLIKNGLDDNQIHFDNSHDITAFLNHSQRLSNFHSEFVTEDAFIQFSKSKGFLTYRLLVNFLYQVFPLLNISPLQKNKLCKVISTEAEKFYQFSWLDLKQLRGTTYESDDIYQKIGTKE
ncbi:hypothetical protein [Bacillus kwashiorkori]|uniref:hypothetical protein n=1 Tax=Bacillus kwashiorkori TaxID=1522318 RepID=UPI000783F70F|nr:hypothetical protein [Bacillus kwashiorkori]